MKSTRRSLPLTFLKNLKRLRKRRSYSKEHSQRSGISAAPNSSLSEKKEGFLSSALADIFAFAPATTFATDEEIKAWNEKTTAIVEASSGGLKKQLELQRQWFLNPKSGEGEYVLNFTSAAKKPTHG